MDPYERFAAWQKCHALVLTIYRATDSWPPSERYGMTQQVRRAAFSAAANLVEGSATRGSPEFRRFLAISLGSLAEVGYTLRVARDLGYIDEASHASLDRLRLDAGGLTWKLYRSLGPS